LEEKTETSSAAEAGEAKPEANNPRSLEEKWGKETIDIGYAVLPSALIRGQARLKIGARELAVLVHLIDHWWHASEMPWPSRKTIGDRLGVGVKAVQNAMVKLEEARLIQRKDRFQKNGGRSSNEYDLSLLVERLKEISADMAKAKAEAKEAKRRAVRPNLKRRTAAAAKS